MLTALLLVQALAAGAITAQPVDAERLKSCLAQIDANAQAALDLANGWSKMERSPEGTWCAAQALIKLGRNEDAARKFEQLASDQGWTTENRAEANYEAGNAWLLANNPDRALESFNHVVKMTNSDPDALIDRARAYAMKKDWAHAEDDLSAALDKRPNDALALMLRSSARVHNNAFELAVKDAEDAAKIDPKNTDINLVLGQAREALRTGKAG